MPDPAGKPPDLDAQGQPVQPPDLDANGQPVGGGMNFAIVNGERVPVDDSPLDLVAGAAHTLNPLPAIGAAGKAIGHGLLSAAAAQAGATDLSNAEGQKALQPFKDILQAQTHVKDQADEAWKQGDTATALRKYVDWLLPVIGPVIDQAADKMAHGQPWRGAGEAIGLGLGLGGPKALETARIKVPAVASARNPVEAAAVEFGRQQGVPIDAATATGNPFVRNVQKATANTPLGSLPAMRMQAAQADALTRVGRGLADQAHPYPQTPEIAGEELQQALRQKVTDLHGQANTGYDQLRQIEQHPENAVQVPAPKTPDQIAFQQAVDERARVSAGRPVTEAEWAELRRIAAELKEHTFEPGGMAKDARNYNAGTFVPRSGGAPVYHDIVQAAPGTSTLSREAVVRSLSRALADGTFTNAAKGALEVAADRVKRGATSEGSPYVTDVQGPTVALQMPVDLAAAKRLFRPIYERITRQLPITQQRASPGLKAISNLLEGPDYAPVSQVDQDLSAIKALARGADLPELKSVSQGIAAHAVTQLEQQIQKAMSAAAVQGDEAAAALRAGREATTSKYRVAEELRQLREEPVQAFQQTTYANDAGVGRLRRLAAEVPDEIPRIGRAWLDQALTKATAEGGFAHAQRMQNEWAKLGPQTKAILFDKPGQAQALDHYFRLARLIAENPNPSGTAYVGIASTSLAALQGLFYAPLTTVGALGSTWGISKLLNSPKAVQLFTKGTTLMLGPGKASKAAMSMGVANVLQAAREAGLADQTMVPAPASASPTRPQDQSAPQSR